MTYLPRPMLILPSSGTPSRIYAELKGSTINDLGGGGPEELFDENFFFPGTASEK